MRFNEDMSEVMSLAQSVEKEDVKNIFEMVDKLEDYVNDNHIQALILGISGGIDSTLAAIVCHYVAKRCKIPFIGRSITIKSNPIEEIDSSVMVGDAFCPNFKRVNWNMAYECISAMFEDDEHELGFQKIPEGNIKCRLRMIYLYHLAWHHKGVVIDTDNWTEHQLGFWTIHGDVGDVNFGMINLQKTRIYEICGTMSRIYGRLNEQEKSQAISKSIGIKPTDGLGITSSDLEQLGASSYAVVDDILANLVGRDVEGKEWSKMINTYTEETVNNVMTRHHKSNFKRKGTPICL